MKLEKCYKLFGACYNEGDFTPLAPHMREDAYYESFDFLYKIKGKERVLDTINSRAKDNQQSETAFKGYSGYIFKEMLTFKRLLPCVILYSTKNKETYRIIELRMKRGKIYTITGLDPKAYSHTRGDLLTR